TAPQPGPVVPPLQPRQAAAPPAASPTRPQATTPPRQPQPAAAPNAVAPPRPTRPGATTPTYATAAGALVKEISGGLQSIFGAEERQKMLADCQADANSDFGKVIAAMPRGGMVFEESVAAYQKAKTLAEQHLKANRKPLLGKLPDKVQ